MISKERADFLTNLLSKDQALASIFFTDDTTKALIQLNALGNEFTLDEIQSYFKSSVEMSEESDSNTELFEEQLTNVTGGRKTYTVIRQSVPIFDHAQIPRKIIGSLDQNTTIEGIGSPVFGITRIDKLFLSNQTWIKIGLGNGKWGYVNMIHLNLNP